jgi:hypothetical protein
MRTHTVAQVRPIGVDPFRAGDGNGHAYNGNVTARQTVLVAIHPANNVPSPAVSAAMRLSFSK